MIRSKLALLLLLVSSSAQAQTINNLGVGAALTGPELIPMFQTANPAVTTSATALKAFIGTTVQTGAGATGGTCTPGTTCTITTQLVPVTITTASPAVSTAGSNLGGVVFLTNASADTPTIPGAGSAGYGLGVFITVCNTVAFTKTFTPGSGTIGGAATYSLLAGSASAPQCIQFESDGVSNYTLSSVPSPAAGITVATTTITGGTNTRVLFDNSGVVGEYTNTQLTALVNVGTSSLSGAVPASPGNTSTFFRGDDTFVTLNCAALSNGATGCSTATGTSGATIPLLNGTNTWSGVQTFTNSDIVLLGSSSGATTFTSANAGASNFTLTFPAATDTVVTLAATQTLTNKSIAASQLTSTVALANGGTNADLSATGGTSQFLKQAGVGSNITVVRPVCADLSDSGTSCTVATGTSGATIPLLNGANTWSGTNTWAQTVSGNQALIAIRNSSANSAAVGTFNFGNNSANGEVTLSLNSSANTGGNGTSSFTINNIEATNTGGIYLQTQGTNAITISKTQAVGLPNIASTSAAQTGAVCWTTGGGNLTVDTTVSCLASLEELKNIVGPITNIMPEVMALNPFWYSWKDEDHYKMDPRVQPGLGAHQVESVDPRLAGYDPDGKLTGVRYQQLTAVLVAAVQELQRQIDLLKERIN